MFAMAGVKRSQASMLGHDVLDRNHHNDLETTVRARRPRASSPSEEVTTRTPSPSFPLYTGGIPDFRADASIAFVGIRGAGKSTLAIMASAAMNRRVIDLETAFQRTCGTSSASYKKSNGAEKFHLQQASVLQDVLERNPTECIIVCSWMETRVQTLLRKFASTNPVIHVVRDFDAIQEHLKISDYERIRKIVGVSRAIFRTCTNLEFFNVSEKLASGMDTPSSDPLLDYFPAPSLTLKHAERHLLKFLSLIFPPGSIPFIESAFPLALVPTEARQFTYSLLLPLHEILEPGFDIEDHVKGADVVEMEVRSPSDAEISSSGFDELADQITNGVGVVRRSTVLPLAMHIKLPENSGRDAIQRYLDLVLHALRLAPEMILVTLRLNDSDILRLVASKGRSKVIGSYFTSTDPPSWDSPTWSSLYQKANNLGCDMARLVRPAFSMDDNLAVADFRASIRSAYKSPIPLIAYNIGALGRHSACFNPILTTVTSKTDESELNAGHFCLNPQLAISALCSSFIYDSMKLYVFGVKVGYSLSPIMHNSALKALGLPHHYRPHSTQSLSAIKSLLEDPYFGGASVGLPFKVEIITLIHSLSRHARAIGAVNTLIPVRHLNPDGSLLEGAEPFRHIGRAGPVKALYGENTDWIGIRACIRRGLSPANAVRPGTSAFVEGAGGMARAAVYALLQVGVQNIVIHNRTVSTAEKLVDHFRQLLQKSEFRSLGAGKETRFEVLHDMDQPWPSQYNLPIIIISCIPTHSIGDVPAPDFTVPEEYLGHRTGGVIIELGYKTLDTPLLAQAKKQAFRGWVALTGLDLLPEQGFAQFELFTGKRAPRRIMREKVYKAYKNT